MGLLAPGLLLLGAAIAVPIILHLFQRHQGPRVVFPALRYLRRAERESARRIRLRQLLLMLLRVTALALLALAAARPFARSGGVGHEPTAVAIVLDNSMSTGLVGGDRRVLDALKDRARETIEGAGPDDRFWLIRAGAVDAPAIAGNAYETGIRVQETEPTAGAADLVAAIERARAVLAAGADGRATEIHLLTDLQATSFAAARPSRDGGPPVLAFAEDEDAPANAAVRSIEIAGGLAPIAGQRSTVVAVVGGEPGEDSVRLRLAVDGRVVAAGAGPATADVVLSLPPRGEGWMTGWVETDPDALRADDRRFFASLVVPPPTVSLSADLPFVEEALTVMEEAGRIRRSAGVASDVMILPAGAGLSSLADGRTAIVLPPPSPLELPALNRRLADAGITWRYEPANAAGEARFATGGTDDELMRAVEGVRLTQVYRLAPPADGAHADSALLSLRDGSAWAVAGSAPRGGRFVLVASPLTASATTVPTSAAMVPLLDRLVGAWAAATPVRTAFDAGTEITIPAGVDAVERPGGEVEAVGGAAFRLGPEPGVYRFTAGERPVLVVAANPPAAESELRRLDRSELATALPGVEVRLIDDPDDWPDAVYRMRLGRELWLPFALLALILLIFESVLAATGRRRKPTAVAGPTTDPNDAATDVRSRPAEAATAERV